jgi:hypothetical protein
MAGQTTGRAQPLPRACVLPTLSGLVGKSVIAMADTPGGCAPRYRMLETVRAYGLERLAEAGEETATRDAFARYYLDFAETADPLLRRADQIRWFRELLAEQDNAHTALRWAIARQDSATALRLVRALGYYWSQRGHGEADVLAREVLALTPPEPTVATAEARVICALLAAGWSYDLETVKGPLLEAIGGLAEWGDDYTVFHPLVALVEPVLLQFEGEHERAQDHFDRYAKAADPWLRAMGLVYRAAHARELGRLAGAEDDLRAALREFRVLGEYWGSAIALTELAEFTERRGDHAGSIAALEEAVSTGRELNAWGDLTYIEARLALVRARTGEFAQASAELDRIDAAAAARGTAVDVDRWVTLIRAELAWREGDLPLAARCCADVLAAIEAYHAPWWEPLRARIRARLAVVVLAQGDEIRSQALLAAALDASAAWTEHCALAEVLDACSYCAIHRDQAGAAELADGGGNAGSSRHQADPQARDRAERAARLLGAAHAVRGAFDQSSPDAPQARAAARAALGEAAFDAAYQSAAGLTYEESLELARAGLTTTPPPGGHD